MTTSRLPMIALVLAGLTARPGSGASDEGVTSTVLARGSAPATGSRPATEVVVSEVTIVPGGTTRWHWHDGEPMAIVKSGTLTRTLEDCSTVTSTTGEAIFEESGADHVHVGRNLGKEPVVLLVTYVLPAGGPLAHQANPPAACAK